MDREPRLQQPSDRDELIREIIRAANKLNWSGQDALGRESEPIDDGAYRAILQWQDKLNLAVASLEQRVAHEAIQRRNNRPEPSVDTVELQAGEPEKDLATVPAHNSVEPSA